MVKPVVLNRHHQCSAILCVIFRMSVASEYLEFETDPSKRHSLLIMREASSTLHKSKLQTGCLLNNQINEK